jgi:hypothetical protein
MKLIIKNFEILPQKYLGKFIKIFWLKYQFLLEIREEHKILSKASFILALIVDKRILKNYPKISLFERRLVLIIILF